MRDRAVLGASADADPALVASDQAASRLAPTGVDPLRGVLVELPWPPASLSGHNTGHWHAKSGIVAKHREWAKNATLAAHVTVPEKGDIRLSITFYPPDRRGDRTNFANRAKPLIDGIADALKVNDRRFLPSYHFAEPVSNARVVVSIG